MKKMSPFWSGVKWPRFFLIFSFHQPPVAPPLRSRGSVSLSSMVVPSPGETMEMRPPATISSSTSLSIFILVISFIFDVIIFFALSVKDSLKITRRLSQKKHKLHGKKQLPQPLAAVLMRSHRLLPSPLGNRNHIIVAQKNI